jgi:hypothetical protein
MPTYAEQTLTSGELTRALKARRADPRQKAIKALCHKLVDVARTTDPDGVFPHVFSDDDIEICTIEIDQDRSVWVRALVAATYSFRGIDEELRPFVIAEESSPLTSTS